MQSTFKIEKNKKSIKRWLAFFMIMLLLSGLTAIPAERELAIAFIGPYKDPVKNKWVIEFGAIACFLIIPFALIAGYFRGIPFWWRLIDCSFGIIGLIPLGACHNKIDEIEKLTVKIQNHEN